MAKNGGLRFSISTILWLTLMVAAFFGGRISIEPEVARAKAQSAQQRAIAEMEAMRAAQQAQLAQKMAQQARADSLPTEASQADRDAQGNEAATLEKFPIVTFVADGDTVKVLQNRKEHWIRLAGIDSPESDQPFGSAAKEFTHMFCFGRQVKIVRQGTDKYDRVLADILVEGMSLSQALLQSGFAWHLPEYNNDASLAKMAEDARRQNIGLWQDANPISPSEWKKQNRRQPR